MDFQGIRDLAPEVDFQDSVGIRVHQVFLGFREPIRELPGIADIPDFAEPV